MENSILDWIQSMRTPIGDAVIPMITKLGDAGIIWILLSAVLLFIPKTRKSGAVLAVALCVNVVLCNGILKNLFRRIRPCDINTSIQLLVARPDDFSFPSGHTAASFAAVAALVLAEERKRPKGIPVCRKKMAIEGKLWIPALVLAVFIAFSRLYLYVHYPTDILGGIVVGIFAGYAGNWIVSQLGKVRNGVVYRNEQTDMETCVLNWDGTIDIYSPDQIDIQQLIEKGAYQSWIFGPSLLDENGKAKESFLTWSYIRESHPRTAIGYYEPGHYCLLLVDGRQESSRGMFLEEMAKVFEDLGCRAAYNLDGGHCSFLVFGGRTANHPYKPEHEVSDGIFITEGL